MLRFTLRHYMTIGFILFFGFIAMAQTHDEAKQKIQYLLAIDRLDFYTQSLADFLDDKKPAELIAALRDLQPEDYFRQRISLTDLNNTQQWQNLVYQALLKKNPQMSVNYSDLQWNYDFFRNKLVQRFTIKEAELKRTTLDSRDKRLAQSQRSIPTIKGSKILLDTDRYISEKTSRAIIWDSILHNREFLFFVGTQTDFQNAIQENRMEIVTEIKPMAQNYNKIYLTFDPNTRKYSYAMNLISGDDRIKHLSAQLRLIKFDGKSYLSSQHDKVKIYGSPQEFHKRQEATLKNLFENLPKVDKVVIGQKGAIDDVIKTAGMKEVISKDTANIMQTMDLGNKASKFLDLMTKVKEVSAFVNDFTLNGSILDKAYEKANDPIPRKYNQFDSEQASHDFTDYLLQDKNGRVQRWRVFSAVWGDEIIPIARALKNTGVKDVVYIGTAGAIANRGLKVGDVIAGNHVYTHSGKKLDFSEGKLAPPGSRPFGIGQVYTPFDETNKWLDTVAKNFDAVEVETGYLREELGDKVKLEAYFLISDIVGSEGESLAHAAQNSSRRKRSQLKLLENLFVQNGIVSPVSNYELLPANTQLKTTYEKLKTLRPSRDEISLLQVAQLAVAQGKSSQTDLEALLKNQPSFTRSDMTEALLTLGNLIAEIQPHSGPERTVGVIASNLFDGTFNPKRKVPLLILAKNFESEEALNDRIGKARWTAYKSVLSKYFNIEVVNKNHPQAPMAKYFHISSAENFAREFEKTVYFPAAFATEVDKKGQYRLRPMPGIDGGLRCEGLFL